MGLVTTTSKETRLSHINSLIAVASADGNFDARERTLIEVIASRLGLSAADVKVLEANADTSFEIPETTEQKLELVYDLTQVMMIDGQMDDTELKVCKDYASKLGFEDVTIALLLASAIGSIRKGTDRVLALSNLHNVL